MVDLHVYAPQQRKNIQPPAGELHLTCGSSTIGTRAKMVYVHGAASEWSDPRAQQWLQESVMTRLVDANPARVVWNA